MLPNRDHSSLCSCSFCAAEKTERELRAEIADLRARLLDADEFTASAMRVQDEQRETIVTLKKRIQAQEEEIARLKDKNSRAEAKAEQYEKDWMAAKYEFGCAMGKARAEIARLRDRDAVLASIVKICHSYNPCYDYDTAGAFMESIQRKLEDLKEEER